jgi:hypothetical protein
MGRTTLHRYPDICAAIRTSSSASQSATGAERRSSRSLTKQIAALRLENKNLKQSVDRALEQNLLLTLELAKLRGPQAPSRPLAIDGARSRRKLDR